MKLPMHIEQFIGNLLAKIFGLYREKMVERDYEVDIALTDFQRLKIVAEVKWRRSLDEDELRRMENILGRFKCRRILIIPSKEILRRELRNVEVWDLKDILSKIE